MENPSKMLATRWFHRRFTLTPEGRYVTVTELAEWARGPYDQLRKNLMLRGANGSRPQVVLLAPARHGDGTTTTAVLLAASLAVHHRCLLLDLNFRWPGIAEALGLNGTRGINELLQDPVGVDVDHAVLPTHIANLFALPNRLNGAPRAVPEVPMLKPIIEALRERFDFIIADAAPVLGYPDTALLTKLVDAVILVVAADSTPVDTCLEARREIEHADVPIAGAVLTRQRRFVPDALARRLGANGYH